MKKLIFDRGAVHVERNFLTKDFKDYNRNLKLKFLQKYFAKMKIKSHLFTLPRLPFSLPLEVQEPRLGGAIIAN